MSDDRKILTLNNKILLAHLRRLEKTGLYGNGPTQVALKLIHDQIHHLLETGKLESLEEHTKKAEGKPKLHTV